MVLAKGAQPVLVSAQSPIIGTAALPNVALYKVSPGGDTLNAYTYSNGNATTTDAVVAGYFLQPASSSVQSFLVHAYFQYQVYDGSTSASSAGLGLNPAKITSNAGCDCSSDPEAISVADFDNDGYSDLGVLLQSYTISGVYYPGAAGVAINSGSSGTPGSFNTFIPAPTPAEVVSPAVFCPVAIATGRFLSSGGTQLAVLASAPQTSCTNVANGPFAVYLFSYSTATSSLTEVGTPLAMPDNNVNTLAAADLNNNGIADLIIGESIAGAAAPTGGIFTALGVGDGTFTTASAVSALPAAPIAYAIADFNGDGNIDVAYTSASGYSILIGNGGGTFSSRSDHITDISSAPGGIASADLNGDGLADLALVSGSAAISDSNLDIALNSASAQAVLALGGQALAAGSYSLTANFPGDSNFAASPSNAVNETVNQTVPVITWIPTASSINLGTALGSAQLDATASVPGIFTYAPPSGTVLPLGNTTVTAAFAPTDTFDYAPASAKVTISVVAALRPLRPPSAPQRKLP